MSSHSSALISSGSPQGLSTTFATVGVPTRRMGLYDWGLRVDCPAGILRHSIQAALNCIARETPHGTEVCLPLRLILEHDVAYRRTLLNEKYTVRFPSRNVEDIHWEVCSASTLPFAHERTILHRRSGAQDEYVHQSDSMFYPPGLSGTFERSWRHRASVFVSYQHREVTVSNEDCPAVKCIPPLSWLSQFEVRFRFRAEIPLPVMHFFRIWFETKEIRNRCGGTSSCLNGFRTVLYNCFAARATGGCFGYTTRLDR